MYSQKQSLGFAYSALIRAFFDEFRRRKVLKVGVACFVGGWVMLQLADIIFPAMRLPDWSISLVPGILIVFWSLAKIDLPQSKQLMLRPERRLNSRQDLLIHI